MSGSFNSCNNHGELGFQILSHDVRVNATVQN